MHAQEERNRVLIFGAGGFIGAYLVEHLHRKGFHVIASDSDTKVASFCAARNVDFIPADITDPKQFEKFDNVNPDFIIHLAALQPATYNPRIHVPGDYIRVNVNGTTNILEYAVRNGVRRIIYGCSHRNTEALWKQITDRPIREEDGTGLVHGNEFSMFALSENAAQDILNEFHALHDLSYFIFRLPPVYGYGPHLEIFKRGKKQKTGFLTFIQNAMNGKPLEIWGNPEVGRDIIYVKDVVCALEKGLAAEKDKNGLLNISSAYQLSLKEEVETIAKVFGEGKNEILYVPEKTHEMPSFVYDNTRAKKILNWEPVYHFESMLRDLKEEMEANNFGFLIQKRQAMFKPEE